MNIYGLIYIETDSILTIDTCIFEKIICDGPGTFIFLKYIQNSNIRIENSVFKDSISQTYFVSAENCVAILFNNNSFTNNSGNMFNIINSNLTSNNNIFNKTFCFFDYGCLFNIKSFSELHLLQNLFDNVTNSNEGGAFYFENSIIYLFEDILINCKSENYASCGLTINSTTYFSNLSAYNYVKGCFYFTHSNIYFENSDFKTISNTISIEPKECLSTFCLENNIKLHIINTKFVGNIDNTLMGGV